MVIYSFLNLVLQKRKNSSENVNVKKPKNDPERANLQKELDTLNKISKAISSNYNDPGLLEQDLKQAQEGFIKGGSIAFENANIRLKPIRDLLYGGLPQLNTAEFKRDLRNISVRAKFIRERLARMK